MDVSTMLGSLRDPMGVPFYPWLFQVLMVLTFALHIFMVNIVVGSVAVGLWGHFKGGDYPRRLSAMLAKSATVNLSIAILLGIAPLLFVQVIYDPFWYSATLMSGWWSMIFLGAVLAAFLLLYVFYLKRKNAPESSGGAGVVSFLALFLCAVIMHMLAMQSLSPAEWVKWYAPEGKMLTGGFGFHAFSFGRFFHFIVPAFLNVGIFMMLYAWYFGARADADKPFLTWVGKVGVKMAKYAAIVQALVGVWFLITIPAAFNFIANPFFLLGAALALVALGYLFVAEKDPARFAPIAGLLSVVGVLGMSTTREVLRMNYLGEFKYSIYDYPVSVDWGSTILFLGTFVMGLIVIAYPIILAFKSGRGQIAGEEM